MKTKILIGLSGALAVLAGLVCSSASAWIFYQPKTPKCLGK